MEQNCGNPNNFFFSLANNEMSSKKLKRTPINGTRVKKRKVVQTAWVIPVAERVSPPKKNQMLSPPDPDEFINLKQVPCWVKDPVEEVFGHNANVVRRGISQRTQKKISDLSKETEEAEAYDSSFIDDSDAPAYELT